MWKKIITHFVPTSRAFPSAVWWAAAWRVYAWWRRDMYALPLDMFRIVAGLLCAAYFAMLALQAEDFSSPDGLLDHRLLQQIFWFTRLSLFQPGLPLAFFYGVFGFAFVGAWGIVLGYRVRLCAALLFVIAVSTYRWNFLVIYVDDGFMHLLLFWLMLLPVGHTLCLGDILSRSPGQRQQWLQRTVPGSTMRCFLANICLIYLIAGYWKLLSPLWQQGFALYAGLRLPIAYLADSWSPEHLPWLRIANYLALVVEPLLPFLLLCRPYHPLKWLGLVCQFGFHVGILLTLKVPLVNLGLLATALLFFRQEIMGYCGAQAEPPAGLSPAPRRLWPERLALVFLLVLSLAVTQRIPIIGSMYKPAYALLWLAGMAQDYRLFDWIDKVNYHVTYRLQAQQAGGPAQLLEPTWLFPRSLRATLVLAYMHNVRWMFVPYHQRPTLRQSILLRLAQRFCRQHDIPGRITAWARAQRLRPDNIALTQGQEQFLLTFQCVESRAVLCNTLIPGAPDGHCEASTF